MGQIHITVSDRVLERAIFIILIIVLGYFAFDGTFDNTAPVDDNMTAPNATAPTDTQEVQNTTDTIETTDNSTDTTDTVDETKSKAPKNTRDQKPQNNNENTDEKLSGNLELTLDRIKTEVTGNTTKVNGLVITVTNGLEDRKELTGDIVMRQTGNQDLSRVNPLWEDVKIAVASGNEQTATVQPSLSYPPGVEPGSDVILEGTFTDASGEINKSVSKTVTIG